MITVTVTLPPNTPSSIIDAISVSVLDDACDRQPRGTYMSGLKTQYPDALTLEFTT